MLRKFVLALAVIVLAPVAALAAGDNGHRTVTVMTRNLYLGYDVAPVITAFLSGDTGQILLAVAQSYAKLQHTDFPARAAALADEIAKKRPDLIGLQEVALFRSQFPPDFSPIPNAETVEFDFLALLLQALADRNLAYEPVVVQTANDIEAPGLLPDLSCCFELRLTEGEVILARSDRHGPKLKLSNPQSGNFTTFLDFGSLGIQRGWASVDVKTGGKRFRFVTTHLEAFSDPIQLAQAVELLAGPAAADVPLVLVCDCNTRGDGTGSATYGVLLGAGLLDAWTELHPADPGYTCCQTELLDNPESLLTERIDFVFSRGGFDTIRAYVVGDDPEDRTESGLWPSDHAGVAAKLRLRRDRDDN
jgi:endonuclease/exonuclease/phosphatase family metal-dependent hydrolase